MTANPTSRCCFTPYLSEEAVEKGIAEKVLYKATLRINQKNYEEAYIDNPEGDQLPDILIYGLRDRNRAFQGDVVAVKIKKRIDWAICEDIYKIWRRKNTANNDIIQREVSATDVFEGKVIGDVCSEVLKPANDAFTKIISYTKEELYSLRSKAAVNHCVENVSVSNVGVVRQKQEKIVRNQPRFLHDLPSNEQDLPEECLQKTAEVVFISEKIHKRIAVGSLKALGDGNRNWALFSPNDPRMPRMMIPHCQVPNTFFDRPQDFSKYLYVARVVEWPETSQFAPGKLCKKLGMIGEIEAETEGLLLANDIDTAEFSEVALASLDFKEGTEWKIDEEELKSRRDFRNEVLFTIDPITARDLDDALHIKPLADCDGAGTQGWEIGVHIADVSHFVKPETELDNWAKRRATSVYLVHKVIPMLPRILCEELCSLAPGVDRLTVSVLWKMDEEANIYEEWFGKSVIRSCCKLAYEHAQEMIENPEELIVEAAYPRVHNKKKIQEVKRSVLRLNKLAEILSEKRTKNGSLRIEQPKLCFDLNESTGLPFGVSAFERKQANSLVEEFMLLANMAVARKIENAFPKTALLRRHPPPRALVLRAVLEKFEVEGFAIDGTSSASLASSLRQYSTEHGFNVAVIQVLSYMLLRSMQLAVYFCTGTKTSKSDYAHYALSVPFYTHFTSPIRRYPDIMVHRFLCAALGNEPAPSLTVKQVTRIAEHCNNRKSAAKIVSDSSGEMFLGLFIKECGPVVEEGVVVQVLDASFDVLIVRYGVVKRVYVNRVAFSKPPRFTKNEGGSPFLTLFWSSDELNGIVEQKICSWTVLNVILSSVAESFRFQASIVKPTAAKSVTLLGKS